MCATTAVRIVVPVVFIFACYVYCGGLSRYEYISLLDWLYCCAVRMWRL
jgi:hypothetical protein